MIRGFYVGILTVLCVIAVGCASTFAMSIISDSRHRNLVYHWYFFESPGAPFPLFID